MGGEPKNGRIGPYDVLRRLEGSGRESYLAQHRDGSSRPVLLVAFELRAEDAKLLRDEVERCKRVEHPAVARVLELLEHQGRYVLACENPAGAPLSAILATLIDAREVLADRAAFHLGRMLFGGLGAAHGATAGAGRTAPIVHGQLGPQQVFVSRSGDVQIAGFGLSRVFRLARSVEGEPEAMKPFLAPELRRGVAPSVRSNVYCAAAMLWAVLARRMPDPAAERLAPLGELRPDLPPALTRALDQALEPSLVKRAITCHELAAAFARVDSDEGKRELGWNVEVLQTPDAPDDAVPPPDSFPPRALSQAPEPPPSSEQEMPTGQWRVPDHHRLRKLIEETEELGRASENAAAPTSPSVAPMPAEPWPTPAGAAGENVPDESDAPVSVAPPSRAPTTVRPRALRARASLARARADGQSFAPPSGRASVPPARVAEASGVARASLPPANASPGSPAAGQDAAGSLSPFTTPSTEAPTKGERARRSRWRSRVANAGIPVKLLGLFAVTAVASFAAGLIVASGPVQVSVGDEPNPSRSGAATAPSDRGADAPQTNGTCSPPSVPTAAVATPGAAASAEAGGPPHTAADDGTAHATDDDDGSSLPAYLGYLLVGTPEPRAHVYVGGEPTGRAGKKLVVRCGLVHVRLGTLPLEIWFGPGRAVPVACRGVTSVNMDQAKAVRSGPNSSSPSPYRRRYWSPDDI